MASSNPLEIAVRGYTALRNAGPDGLAFGSYSRRSASNVRSFESADVVVMNMERARWIARTFHDWDVASEHKLHAERMAGNIEA